MRLRTNIILEESILKKIDAIAGEKQKRAAVIETALREYIEREEAKMPPVDLDAEAVGEKVGARTR